MFSLMSKRPWLIAVLITAIALAGVFLNFFLIERPMSEIVGEGARIGGVGLPAVAAIVVIFLEFVAGVILMDAAGFTKLIPAFHSMTQSSRRIMFFVAFGFLTAFSVLEITLSIVREEIIEQQQETRDIANRALLAPAPTPDAAAPDATAPAETSAAPANERPNVFGLQLSTFAQVILAAIIPWLLAAAALPLEAIVRNSVFMASIAGSYLMLFSAFLFKTLAVLFKNIGLFVLSIYDLIIFAPLWIERRVKGVTRGHRAGRDEEGLDGLAGGEDEAPQGRARVVDEGVEGPVVPVLVLLAARAGAAAAAAAAAARARRAHLRRERIWQGRCARAVAGAAAAQPAAVLTPSAAAALCIRSSARMTTGQPPRVWARGSAPASRSTWKAPTCAPSTARATSSWPR